MRYIPPGQFCCWESSSWLGSGWEFTMKICQHVGEIMLHVSVSCKIHWHVTRIIMKQRICSIRQQDSRSARISTLESWKINKLITMNRIFFYLPKHFFSWTNFQFLIQIKYSLDSNYVKPCFNLLQFGFNLMTNGFSYLNRFVTTLLSTVNFLI